MSKAPAASPSGSKEDALKRMVCIFRISGPFRKPVSENSSLQSTASEAGLGESRTEGREGKGAASDKKVWCPGRMCRQDWVSGLGNNLEKASCFFGRQ